MSTDELVLEHTTGPGYHQVKVTGHLPSLLKRQAPNDPTPTMNSPSRSIPFGQVPWMHYLDMPRTDCVMCNLEFHVRYRDIR